jgi:hypothetical protein
MMTANDIKNPTLFHKAQNVASASQSILEGNGSQVPVMVEHLLPKP